MSSLGEKEFLKKYSFRKESSKLKEKEQEQILNALVIKQEIKLILKTRGTKYVNFRILAPSLTVSSGKYQSLISFFPNLISMLII